MNSVANRNKQGHTALSVNLNKIALVRNSRHLGIPSVVKLGTQCLEAGAHGLTVHPRPDARHIRPEDVRDLALLLRGWPDREFNIEGNPFQNLMPIVRTIRPQQVTFVPDSEGQLTSDHGWDLATAGARLRPLIEEAHALGVRVSLFMDPATGPMKDARALGADRVELYTESYARAYGTSQQDAVLAAFSDASKAALDVGLGVNAGHDLNLVNLGPFVHEVPQVLEVSIGHALMADALEMGYRTAVEAYLQCLRN